MADRYGDRPRCAWGDGDLPAPWAIGDRLDVPAGAQALERMLGMGPGRYRICDAWSIDEGDAWYFRVTPDRRMARNERRLHSDRLHVIAPDPSRVSPELLHGGPVDWLAGCVLVETSDPEGLRRRAEILAAGWTVKRSATCPTCHGAGRVPEVE